MYLNSFLHLPSFQSLRLSLSLHMRDGGWLHLQCQTHFQLFRLLFTNCIYFNVKHFYVLVFAREVYVNLFFSFIFSAMIIHNRTITKLLLNTEFPTIKETLMIRS